MKFDIKDRTVPENAVWCPLFDEDYEKHGAVISTNGHAEIEIAAVCVISTRSFAYRRAMQRKMREPRFSPIIRDGRDGVRRKDRDELTEQYAALLDLFELELLRDVVLVSWLNFFDGDAHVPYSREAADTLLANNQWFRSQVQSIAGAISILDTDEKEEAQKNYVPS